MNSIKQTLKALSDKYAVFRDSKPLAIGVVLQIDLPGYDANDIQRALRSHTNSQRYLLQIKHGDIRYNLDGTHQKPISPEQREMTRLKLNIRSTKRMAQTYMQKNNLTAMPSNKQARIDRNIKNLEAKLAAIRTAL